MTTKRVGYIDIMKGLAILAVMGGHYCGIGPLGTLIYSFHMPLFVVISGYFYKQIPLIDLIRKNIKHLLVPYILVVLGVLVIELLTAYLTNLTDGSYIPYLDVIKRRVLSAVYALASNSTLHKPEYIAKVGAVWFLNALFMGSILLHWILKLKHKFIQIIGIFFLLVMACIQTAICCIPGGLNYACAFLFWLYIGYNLRQSNKLDRLSNLPSSGRILLLVIWLSIVVVEYETHHSFNIIKLQFPLYGLEIVGAFCGILYIGNVSYEIEKNLISLSKILRKCGRNTMWILCAHALDIELWVIALTIFQIFNLPRVPGACVVFRILLDLFLAFIMKRIWKLIISNYYLKQN